MYQSFDRLAVEHIPSIDAVPIKLSLIDSTTLLTERERLEIWGAGILNDYQYRGWRGTR